MWMKLCATNSHVCSNLNALTSWHNSSEMLPYIRSIQQKIPWNFSPNQHKQFMHIGIPNKGNVMLFSASGTKHTQNIWHQNVLQLQNLTVLKL